jgi:hypothetical protein
MKRISYSGYRFPPTIIQQAIWLYLRFTLSLRDVEDLSLKCLPVIVTHRFGREHGDIGFDYPFQHEDFVRPASVVITKVRRQHTAQVTLSCSKAR